MKSRKLSASILSLLLAFALVHCFAEIKESNCSCFSTTHHHHDTEQHQCEFSSLLPSVHKVTFVTEKYLSSSHNNILLVGLVVTQELSVVHQDIIRQNYKDKEFLYANTNLIAYKSAPNAPPINI